jgi:uncharacterized protein YkwD
MELDEFQTHLRLKIPIHLADSRGMRAGKFASYILVSIFCLSCSQKESLSNGGRSGSDGASHSSTGQMTSLEYQMYQETNSTRAANGLPALKILTTCVRMAQDHAYDMYTRGYFAHDSPTETFAQRAARYGLGAVGENIAGYSSDVPSTMNQWMNSPGHRANILNNSWASMGVGFYQGRWVQCFTSAPGDVP